MVGVDGSTESLRAVRFGAAEAERRGVSLRLVHAFAWVDESGDRHVRGGRYRDKLLAEAWHLVASAADLAAVVAPGIDVEQQVEVGFPIEILVDESRRGMLLVVGDRGLSRFTGLLIGSVSVALAAHADCPVVVVRADARSAKGSDDDAPSGRPVVVGIDGTPTSEAATAFAFEEAAARRVPLVAVHAWSLPPVRDAAAPATDAGVAAHETLAERLAGWTAKYPDVDVRREVLQDRPVPVLIKEAGQAQLLVVGSRGRGRLAGMVLGSVAHALVHGAPCPVAVVRPDASG